MKSPTCKILYQTILATIHKSGLYDFIQVAYSQPLSMKKMIGDLFFSVPCRLVGLIICWAEQKNKTKHGIHRKMKNSDNPLRWIFVTSSPPWIGTEKKTPTVTSHIHLFFWGGTFEQNVLGYLRRASQAKMERRMGFLLAISRRSSME